MKITFLGAAGNVTGSRFLVEGDNSRILIDCGLYQEREYLNRNWEPCPVKPESLDAVLLTHAHLDHCGYLPCLVRAGFEGKIYCTPATAEIVKIILLDAAKIQEEDALFKKKRHEKEGRTSAYPERPLYTVEEARAVFPLLFPMSYGEIFSPINGLSVCFYNAGHILGAATVKISFLDEGKNKHLVFSGDIGRQDQPLLCPPESPEAANVLFLESTYGDRNHEPWPASLEKLERVIIETTKHGGKVVIPSFALERAQEVLYHLKGLFQSGAIPPLPVYVDSPMAIDITEIFEKFPQSFCSALRNGLRQNEPIFNFPFLRFTKTVEESKAINEVSGPVIIIAGSGMCTGGRIKHHLAQTISQPENTILFVGYQAKGTLGREILERPRKVRIHGQDRQVRARIEKINGFSAHADQKDIQTWFDRLPEKPAKVFIIHGETAARTALAAILRDSAAITLPEYLDSFPL
ncbi:MAG: MBL fold metallo-hydrolase [Candidatus Omnitrophica bacterium]|nr:MBL fold metallo-hydrolase [Candidatus Omnitrophota bacterium]